MKIMRKQVVLFVLLVSSSGYASADIATAGASIKPLINLALSVAVLVGLILFMTGWYGLKKNAQDPQRYTIGYCAWNMISGIFLIMPSVLYAILGGSVIGNGHGDIGLSYDASVADSVSNISNSAMGTAMSLQAFTVLYGFIYLVGAIYFLKGIFLLRDLGSPGGRDGSGSKITYHLLGGIFCMNLGFASCLFGSIFGLTFMCGV
jgi:hypothetical protein